MFHAVLKVIDVFSFIFSSFFKGPNPIYFEVNNPCFGGTE
jgi:hypothetical protein